MDWKDRMEQKIDVGRTFRRFRIQEVATMTIVYAIFYVCRLAFSAAKKDMIELGSYTAEEIGWVGSSMLIAYAIGKCVNGFIADRANITRFMGLGLFASALMNFLVGFHLPALILIAIWFVNGWTQGMGAPACVVGLSRWFTKRERGTFYGIWSCSNNIGEALAYLLTAGVMVWVAKSFGADYGWRSGFWGAGLIGFIGVAICLIFFKNSPQDEGLPSVTEWKGEVEVAAQETKDVSKGQVIALTSWAVWMIALSGAFFAMSRYAIIDWGIFFLQVKKGYSATTAAMIIAINSIVGGFAGAASGWISDRFFRGGRNGLALTFGLMNVVSLCLFMLVPGQHMWVDVLAMCLFGTAMGILLCFLGGLMAVDLVPRNAAGAAMGVVAFLSYGGAAAQSRVSAMFIETAKEGGKLASTFKTTTLFGFTVDTIAIFWIGMAVLSVLCALSVWRVKPRD